ncbi:hypothetical protein CAEBREN_28598 [Caenorhabditis brenneri]|uniref:Uncharacterized protein n=1 Tax=Caenorhabditis brenneri TaxID=135651 RepID=G0NX88_CAEBE|nr:hypothetical protein CAEBREN_28598 [Caenorhabditis brenneri]
MLFHASDSITDSCYDETLKVCATPTTTEPPTTVTTTPAPKPTIDPEFQKDWQIQYLFAITNRTTQDQFNNLVKYISDPLQDCNGRAIIIRFLARNNTGSDWFTDVTLVASYLQQLKPDEVLIGSG